MYQADATCANKIVGSHLHQIWAYNCFPILVSLFRKHLQGFAPRKCVKVSLCEMTIRCLEGQLGGLGFLLVNMMVS